MNSNSPEDTNIRNIRRLIWLYFWLLLFEGALRKWVVPQLSNPLLIVRDPVLILIYLLAIRARVFPNNAWVISVGVIGLLAFAVSFVPLWPFLPPSRILLVTGFGLRSNFLHLPLIFVMPRVLRMEDVKRFGWWTLALTVPMALLMVGQFQSAPDSFLNRTAGGEGEMMIAALGKVRTAGTFSFVVGVVAFFALATAFLIWAALRRGVYKSWLLYAAGIALAIGTAVSGSRSVVAGCAIVIASLVVILVLKPQALNRFGHILLVTLVLGFIVTRTPIFKEGFNVLSTRFSEVAEATEKSVGADAFERISGDFRESWLAFTKAPFLGYGLGIGTNAGAKFLTGRATFLLTEVEWSRLFLESGPVLGLAFVLWRCGLVARLGLLCVRSVKRSNVLPLLIFSSTFAPLVNGQLGQPTILGFAVFASGLALSARREEETLPSDNAPDEMVRTARALPRRSQYAERLHGSAPLPDHTNGAVDR